VRRVHERAGQPARLPRYLPHHRDERIEQAYAARRHGRVVRMRLEMAKQRGEKRVETTPLSRAAPMRHALAARFA
jgi:hypothetical protein